jgi:hypothetical protein
MDVVGYVVGSPRASERRARLTRTNAMRRARLQQTMRMARGLSNVPIAARIANAPQSRPVNVRLWFEARDAVGMSWLQSCGGGW